jgi:hypothetical protein
MGAPPEIARIEASIGFQRRVWRAERVGWLAMAAIVLAAFGGAFGGAGPLARGQAEAGGLIAEWPRIARLGAASTLRIALPADPASREAELRLPPDFARDWRLRAAVPVPLEAEGGARAFTLRLRRDAAGAAGVTLDIEPNGGIGLRRLLLESGGQVLDLPVLIWP